MSEIPLIPFCEEPQAFSWQPDWVMHAAVNEIIVPFTMSNADNARQCTDLVAQGWHVYVSPMQLCDNLFYLFVIKGDVDYQRPTLYYQGEPLGSGAFDCYYVTTRVPFNPNRINWWHRAVPLTVVSYQMQTGILPHVYVCDESEQNELLSVNNLYGVVTDKQVADILAVRQANLLGFGDNGSYEVMNNGNSDRKRQ